MLAAEDKLLYERGGGAINAPPLRLFARAEPVRAIAIAHVGDDVGGKVGRGKGVGGAGGHAHAVKLVVEWGLAVVGQKVLVNAGVGDVLAQSAAAHRVNAAHAARVVRAVHWARGGVGAGCVRGGGR